MAANYATATAQMSVLGFGPDLEFPRGGVISETAAGVGRRRGGGVETLGLRLLRALRLLAAPSPSRYLN